MAKAINQNHINVQKEFIEKHRHQLNKESVAGVEKEIKKLEKELSEIKDDPNLPFIPMKPNTHTKNVKGFVHSDNTKVTVTPDLLKNPVTNIITNYVKGAWNALPDEERDLVKKLKIIKSKARMSSTYRGGSWDPREDVLTIFINPRSGFKAVTQNLFHEIGHGKWWNMKKNNPEKIEEFKRRFKELGSKAPTEYAESYKRIADKQLKRERNFLAWKMKHNVAVEPWEQKRLDENRDLAGDLYENESHSELNAHVLGWLRKDVIVSEKVLKEYVNMYKEVYDLD